LNRSIPKIGSLDPELGISRSRNNIVGRYERYNRAARFEQPDYTNVLFRLQQQTRLEIVLKVQFSVIASEVKQTMMLNLNGLLRAIALAMTKKENFKTAPGKSSAPAL